MAMRTVGRSGGASSSTASLVVGVRRVDATARPEEHDAEREADDRHRDPGPARATAPVAVGQRRADRPREIGPEAEGEDGAQHEQADRQHVGPVPGQLAPRGLPPPGQAPGAAGGVARVGRRPRSSGPPAFAAGFFFERAGARDHAASWSRASPKANTAPPPTTASPRHH